MDAFIGYLLQFGNLNPQQIDLIRSKATETTLPKDAYISEAGKVPPEGQFYSGRYLPLLSLQQQG
jgi:hypothetical protein